MYGDERGGRSENATIETSGKRKEKQKVSADKDRSAQWVK